MSAPDLGAAIVASLDDETVRALAERLRPYLDGPNHRPLLTPAQAAERLSVHPKTVVRMARDGRLPAVKVGTGWRFDPDRLVIVPRPRAQTPLAGRSRPGAHRAGIPRTVRTARVFVALALPVVRSRTSPHRSARSSPGRSPA